MMKRICSILLCLIMILGMLQTTMVTTVYGDVEIPMWNEEIIEMDVIEEPTSNARTDVSVTTSSLVFSLSVPLNLPINVDSYGNVEVSTECELVNNSGGAVVVSNVEVTAENGWEIVDFDTDFSSKKVGLQEFGMILNDDEVDTNGSVSLGNDWTVLAANGGTLPIEYEVNVASQATAIELDIATLEFTIEWSSEDVDGSDNGNTDEYTTPTIFGVTDGEIINVDLMGVYTEPTVTATSNDDTDLEVVVSGDTVDTYMAGTYNVVYTATDSSDNTEVVNIEVVVSDEALITTQDEFDILIASDTWLGATSVIFDGTNGVFEFVFAGGMYFDVPFCIPSTVKTIKGIKDATLNAVLWYSDSKDGDTSYSISGISSYGFVNCSNLTDCTRRESAESFGYGFKYCTNLTSCISESGECSVTPFEYCNNLTDCSVAGVSGPNNRAFANCTDLTNCSATADVGNVFLFIACTNLKNCTAESSSKFCVGYYGCTELTVCIAKASGDDSKGYCQCTDLVECIAEMTGDASASNAFSSCTDMTDCSTIEE